MDGIAGQTFGPVHLFWFFLRSHFRLSCDWRQKFVGQFNAKINKSLSFMHSISNITGINVLDRRVWCAIFVAQLHCRSIRFRVYVSFCACINETLFILPSGVCVMVVRPIWMTEPGLVRARNRKRRKQGENDRRFFLFFSVWPCTLFPE